VSQILPRVIYHIHSRVEYYKISICVMRMQLSIHQLTLTCLLVDNSVYESQSRFFVSSRYADKEDRGHVFDLFDLNDATSMITLTETSGSITETDFDITMWVTET